MKEYESGDETKMLRGQLSKDTSWEAPAGPLQVLLQEQEQKIHENLKENSIQIILDRNRLLPLSRKIQARAHPL